MQISENYVLIPIFLYTIGLLIKKITDKRRDVTVTVDDFVIVVILACTVGLLIVENNIALIGALVFILCIIMSLLVSIGGGHYLIDWIIGTLHKKAKTPRGQLAAEVGWVERFTIAMSWALGYPQFIGLWLIVKVLSRWNLKIEVDDMNKGTATVNTFLIGNLLSVCFGIIGGLIIRVAWEYLCISQIIERLLFCA